MVSFRDAASVILERFNFLRQAGLSFEGQRDLYEVLGYERTLTTTLYRQRYARGGIAGRLVDVYPAATWRGAGELIEDPDPNAYTPFEQAWTRLSRAFKIWSVLQRADTLAGLGRYAVVLIGAPGDLSDPMTKGPLLYLAPYSEDDAEITVFETDATSLRFGWPKQYGLKRLDPLQPHLRRTVHWSRVIHIAEKPLDTEVYGQPRLERVWNLLDDLDKVTGGGAEAFWLRANQGLQLDMAKDMRPLGPEEKQELKDQVDEYAHQMRRVLRTRGITTKTLGSDVADFGTSTDTVLKQIAGSIGIPMRILTGSEMGQLASGQDRDNWDTQVQDRRLAHAEPFILRPLVDRMIQVGMLPTPELPYEVRWASVQDLSETERSAGAKAWADTNNAAGKTVFSAEEIRDHWYGMTPLEDEDLDEVDDDVTRLTSALRKGASVTVVGR